MRTLKKIWNWIDDRSGFTEIFMPLIKHPVPPGSKWSYVFGSATLFCLVLQVITGVALSLLYQPSSSEAYQSLQFITNQAAFGNVLRGIHYFGASGMIIMVSIHMIRVYITAAYKYPREMTWISGVILFFMTIAMGFTGQLLRWDSNGVWSSVVAAEQLGRLPFIGKWAARLLLGGDTIGGHSLSRFYSYHVFIIPTIIFLFVGYHLMLIVRNGISEPVKVGRLTDPKTYRAWYKQMLVEKGVSVLALCCLEGCNFRSSNNYNHNHAGNIHRAACINRAAEPSFVKYKSITGLVYVIHFFLIRADAA